MGNYKFVLRIAYRVKKEKKYTKKWYSFFYPTTPLKFTLTQLEIRTGETSVLQIFIIL